jgi:hypothetical protein
VGPFEGRADRSSFVEERFSFVADVRRVVGERSSFVGDGLPVGRRPPRLRARLRVGHASETSSVILLVLPYSHGRGREMEVAMLAGRRPEEKNEQGEEETRR